jgi:hypothetical protein
MKMRAFKCDNCGKESEIILEGTIQNVFPYEKGWLYVYNLELKNLPVASITIKDGHFCSLDCFTQKIRSRVEEKKE